MKKKAKMTIVLPSLILLFTVFTLPFINPNIGKPLGKTGLILSEILYAELYCTSFCDKNVTIYNKDDIQLLLNLIEESTYKKRIIHMPWYQTLDGDTYYEITFYSNDHIYNFGFSVGKKNEEKKLIAVGSIGNPQNQLISFNRLWLLESDLYDGFKKLYNSE